MLVVACGRVLFVVCCCVASYVLFVVCVAWKCVVCGF